MTITAVIFDLDGTLVEFKLDYRTERVEVQELLIEEGVPDTVLSMEDGLFAALRRVMLHMREVGEAQEKIERIKTTVLTMADQYELRAARETNLIPRVHETLQTLKNMKLEIALFTIDGEKATSSVLRRFSIRHFFDAVITRDSVSAVKPDSAHLQVALDALKVKPSEAIVVGDSTLDMKCASALEVLAVGVITGIATAEGLVNAGASYLASSAAEIPQLIQKLTKNAARS